MSRRCSVADCDREWVAKGVCLKHYKAARRPKPLTSAERFWTRYTVTPSGCWEWSTLRTDGYGQVTIDGRKWLAHRYAYTTAVGPIGAGLQIDHLCKNPPCMNPAHLEVVTPHENNMRSDSLAAQRARMTHCPRGHAFTPENIYARPDRKQSRMCRTCCQIRESKRERRYA